MEKAKAPSALSLSNLALKHLVEENQFLVNGFVNKIQSLENGWFKMKIHTKTVGDKTMVVAPNAFFVSTSGLNARQNPGGFSAFLKKYLYNERIVSLKQHGLDRIVVFEFPESYLVLEMFSKGNAILCNKEMQILMAQRKEEWKDRKLEKNEVYKFPSSKGISPLDEKENNFFDKIKSNPKTFFGACVDILNVSPAILESVFEELGFDKKKNSSEATEKQANSVLESLKKIYSSIPTEAYLSEGVIYSTKTTKVKEKVFPSVNASLNDLLLADASSGKGKEELATEKQDIVDTEKATDKAKKDIEFKLKQIEALEKEEALLKEKGEKLFLHYGEITDLVAAIKRAREKGISEKEIKEKLKMVSPIVLELKLSENKLSLRL